MSDQNIFHSKLMTRMGVTMRVVDDGYVQATVALDDDYEGPPGHVHGGILTSLLDEAMNIAVWSTGRPVLAVNLNINFRRPVPVGVEITIKGKMESEEGRKAFTLGTITLPDGKVAVEGAGIFVGAPDHIIQNGQVQHSQDNI